MASWRLACQQSDVTALLSAYEDEAVFVTPTGEVLEGKEQLREALCETLELAPCSRRTETRRCLESRGLALFINAWSLDESGQDPDSSAATLGLMIARQQPGGGWLIAIDAPYGTV